MEVSCGETLTVPDWGEGPHAKEPIAMALRRVEAGAPVAEVCR